MDILPKEIEDIIYDYVLQLKYIKVMVELKFNVYHTIKFNEKTVLLQTKTVFKKNKKGSFKKTIKKTTNYQKEFYGNSFFYYSTFTPLIFKAISRTWTVCGELLIYTEKEEKTKKKCLDCNVFVYEKNWNKHCGTKTHLKNIKAF